MRFLILVKATKDSEAGVMPPESLIDEMAAYHEELARAGVLVDGAGLQRSARGWRIQYSKNGQKSFVDGPFPEVREYFQLEDFGDSAAVERHRKIGTIKP
jgi:hypothetical protein